MKERNTKEKHMIRPSFTDRFPSELEESEELDSVEEEDPGFLEDPFDSCVLSTIVSSRSAEMLTYYHMVSDGQGNLSGYFYIIRQGILIIGNVDVMGYLMTYSLEIYSPDDSAMTLYGVSVLPASIWDRYRRAEIARILSEAEEPELQGWPDEPGSRPAYMLTGGDWTPLSRQEIAELSVLCGR